MSFLDEGARLIRTAAGVPQRVVGLIGEAEDLLAQARKSLAALETISTDAAASIRRVSKVLDDTDAVMLRTRAITEDATETLGAARTLTQDANGMITQIEPEMQKVLPLLEKFADSLSPAEIDAAIALVDELPTLTRSLREDILPILATLDHVGPDINELLHVMDDVRKAVLGVPGFGFFRKRGEERIEEDDDLDPHPHDEALARSRAGSTHSAQLPS